MRRDPDVRMRFVALRNRHLMSVMPYESALFSGIGAGCKKADEMGWVCFEVGGNHNRSAYVSGPDSC